MKLSNGANIYLLSQRRLNSFNLLPKQLSPLVWILKALWWAVWLGLLDTKELNQITWAFYMGKSGFETEEFNIYRGLWPWEANAIEKHFTGQKHVLVAGAGGGREVIALARSGYDVTAFDFSSYLTVACRKNLKKAGCNARVLDAQADGIPEGLDIHDALLIGRGFYHHIPGRARRVAFLQACRARLEPGAPIILSDFFTRPASSRFFLKTQTIANLLRWLRNSPERVEVGDWLNATLQHAFTREEIEQEFLDAHISLEIFSVSPFDEDSQLAHAIAHTF